LTVKARQQPHDLGSFIGIDLPRHAEANGVAMSVCLVAADPDDLDIG
jgi:hypothetical protein